LVQPTNRPIHRSATGHLAGVVQATLHTAARTAWHRPRGVVAHAVRDRCDVFRGRALVTTPDTRHNSPGDAILAAPAVSERGLLHHTGMEGRRRERLLTRARVARGFSLIELLMVVAIIAVMGGIAMGVTNNMVRTAKGKSGAQQLSSFLKRHRELAISRRRNIEIDFTAPNLVVSRQRAVPDPPNPLGPTTVLETMYLEGQIGYRKFAAVALDTPDAFGSAAAINLGGANPVMFTSEGTFADVNGDPINATLLLGVLNQPSTANAVTIIGTTATLRLWRWDGSRWVQ
jgi:prepilin-type N-terminal cleavage/methylation domain-containing protein